MQINEFKNKVVLITGATSGIGEATAKLFASKGAKVVLVGRNADKGSKLETDIRNKGYESTFIKCDVSNEDDVVAMVNKTIATYKKIDILFNNAGVMLKSSEVERMSFEDWKTTFDINIHGMFLVSKYAKPYLVEQKGLVINNASIAGLQHYAVGRSYAYSASKAAVIQFSHQAAKNWAEENVRVNCICPGIVETSILGDRDHKVYAERVPLKRLATPDEVAKIVLFLASNDASYLTGVVLPIDGGVSL